MRRYHKRLTFRMGPGFEPLSKLVSYALGEFACIDEHEGGSMLSNEVSDAIEDLAELTTGRDRFQLGIGKLNGHVEPTLVAAIYDLRHRSVRTHATEEPGHNLERLLRGRQTDPLEVPPVLLDQVAEPFEADRQMAPTFVSRQGVGLVDNHRPDVAQRRPG